MELHGLMYIFFSSFNETCRSIQVCTGGIIMADFSGEPCAKSGNIS